MHLELLSLVAVTLPQGPGAPALPAHEQPRLAFPAEAEAERFQPFAAPVHEGRAQVPDFRASAALDLDDDGNRDVAFLAQGSASLVGGSPQPTLVVYRAHTGFLGSYLPWHTSGTDATDLAAHRVPGQQGSRLVLARPNAQAIHELRYSWTTDPRDGQWSGGPVLSWKTGPGVYEIETHDASGDGHHDIAVLRHDAKSGLHELQLLDVRPYGTTFVRTLTIPVPAAWQPRQLRMLDIDADGLEDLVFTLPGIGIVFVRDTGTALVPSWFLPFTGPVRDLATGDRNRDGHDDLLVVVDGGVLSIEHSILGRALYWLPDPAGAGDLRAGAYIDGDGDGRRDVVVFAADRAQFVVHPSGGNQPFLGAESIQPNNQAPFAGDPDDGNRLLVLDVDNDGDDDALMRVPADGSWILARDHAGSKAPIGLRVEDLGRIGESSVYLRVVRVTVDPNWVAQGIDTLEIAAYVRPRHVPEHTYWGRLQIPVVKGIDEIAFFMEYEANDTRWREYYQNGSPVIRSGAGLAVGGGVLLSIHGKKGPRRHESAVAEHGGGGDGNKSTLGITWRVRAAPPPPKQNTVLLPWD